MALMNAGNERQAVNYLSDSSETKQGNANTVAEGNKRILERYAGNLERSES